MTKLSKHTLIQVKDFEPALFGSITFNNTTLPTLSDSYDITDSKKEMLFAIQNKLDSLYENEKQSFNNFLVNLLKLHNELKEITDSIDFSITSNGKTLTAQCKCTLKKDYQTEKQLASQN